MFTFPIYSKSPESGTELLSKSVVRPPDTSNRFMTGYQAAFAQVGGEINYSCGRAVDDFGTIVNAADGIRIGTLILPTAPSRGMVRTVPDAVLNRIWGITEERYSREISSYQLNDLAFRKTVDLTGVPDDGLQPNIPTTDLIRWGNDGLAFATSGRIVLLTGPFVAP